MLSLSLKFDLSSCSVFYTIFSLDYSQADVTVTPGRTVTVNWNEKRDEVSENAAFLEDSIGVKFHKIQCSCYCGTT